jgi:hypothetical protein
MSSFSKYDVAQDIMTAILTDNLGHVEELIETIPAIPDIRAFGKQKYPLSIWVLMNADMIPNAMKAFRMLYQESDAYYTALYAITRDDVSLVQNLMAWKKPDGKTPLLSVETPVLVDSKIFPYFGSHKLLWVYGASCLADSANCFDFFTRQLGLGMVNVHYLIQYSCWNILELMCKWIAEDAVISEDVHTYYLVYFLFCELLKQDPWLYIASRFAERRWAPLVPGRKYVEFRALCRLPLEIGANAGDEWKVEEDHDNGGSYAVEQLMYILVSGKYYPSEETMAKLPPSWKIFLQDLVIRQTSPDYAADRGMAFLDRYEKGTLTESEMAQVLLNTSLLQIGREEMQAVPDTVRMSVRTAAREWEARFPVPVKPAAVPKARPADTDSVEILEEEEEHPARPPLPILVRPRPLPPPISLQDDDDVIIVEDKPSAQKRVRPDVDEEEEEASDSQDSIEVDLRGGRKRLAESGASGSSGGGGGRGRGGEGGGRGRGGGGVGRGRGFEASWDEPRNHDTEGLKEALSSFFVDVEKAMGKRK